MDKTLLDLIEAQQKQIADLITEFNNLTKIVEMNLKVSDNLSGSITHLRTIAECHDKAIQQLISHLTIGSPPLKETGNLN